MGKHAAQPVVAGFVDRMVVDAFYATMIGDEATAEASIDCAIECAIDPILLSMYRVAIALYYARCGHYVRAHDILADSEPVTRERYRVLLDEFARRQGLRLRFNPHGGSAKRSDFAYWRMLGSVTARAFGNRPLELLQTITLLPLPPRRPGTTPHRLRRPTDT